jgi:hypothetical protein
LAPYVPVEIETPRVRYDAVLIDDDCFMQLTRNMRVQVQRNRWHAFLPRKTSSPNQKRSISRHHSTLK